MTALVVWGEPGPVAVRVNWGRWLADCPACGSALAVEPGSRVLGAPVWEHDGAAWVRVGFREGCWDCGARTDLVWPDGAFVDGVERLLAMRPHAQTRNWQPGETLHDLLRENAAHGLFSVPAIEGLARPGEELLAVGQDGRVEVDRLPSTRPLSSAPAPLAIGAR